MEWATFEYGLCFHGSTNQSLFGNAYSHHLNMDFVSMGVRSKVLFEMPIVTIAWPLDFQRGHHLISNWKAQLFNSKINK